MQERIRPGYKQTEVGVIPEDWRVEQLGKVLTLQRGFDLPKRVRSSGSIPIVSSSGVEDYHAVAAAKGPGLVTGRYGTIGKVFLVEGDYWPLNTTLWVRDFHGNDPFWAFRILQTVDFASHSGKSGVPGVNRNDVHGEIVCVPPIPEQRVIAEALGDADARIAALEALIAKKRDLKQAAMQQLLTGKIRLPGLSGEWEAWNIGDVADVKTGPFGAQLHESDYVRVGTPIITVEHLGEFGIVVDDSVPLVSDEDKNRLKAYQLEQGDIVFSRVGSVDRNALVRERETGWLFSGRLLRVRPNKQIDSGFLNYLFHTAPFKARVLTVAVGQTMASLNTKILKGISIELPPSREEQTAIAEILCDMDADLAAVEAEAAKARAIKQGMMQTLLTGQVRLV